MHTFELPVIIKAKYLFFFANEELIIRKIMLNAVQWYKMLKNLTIAIIGKL